MGKSLSPAEHPSFLYWYFITILVQAAHTVPDPVRNFSFLPIGVYRDLALKNEFNLCTGTCYSNSLLFRVMSSITSLSHLLHLAVLELVLVLFLLLLLQTQTRVPRYQWLHLPFGISHFHSFVYCLLSVVRLCPLFYRLLSSFCRLFFFFALLVVFTLLCASRKYCWKWDSLFLYFLHWWNNFGSKWLTNKFFLAPIVLWLNFYVFMFFLLVWYR
jgi:hypothetical protein